MLGGRLCARGEFRGLRAETHESRVVGETGIPCSDVVERRSDLPARAGDRAAALSHLRGEPGGGVGGGGDLLLDTRQFVGGDRQHRIQGPRELGGPVGHLAGSVLEAGGALIQRGETVDERGGAVRRGGCPVGERRGSGRQGVGSRGSLGGPVAQLRAPVVGGRETLVEAGGAVGRLEHALADGVQAREDGLEVAVDGGFVDGSGDGVLRRVRDGADDEAVRVVASQQDVGPRGVVGPAAHQVGAEGGRDRDDQVVPARLQTGRRVGGIGVAEVEPCLPVEAVDEVLPRVDLAVADRDGHVLVHDRDRHVAESSVGIPVAREVDAAVQQRDEQDEGQREPGEGALEALEFEPGERQRVGRVSGHGWAPSRCAEGRRGERPAPRSSR